MAMVIAVTQCLVIGIAAALLLEPDMTPRRLLGTAYLLGAGIGAFLLLALSLLRIAWSPTSFTLAFCIVASVLWFAILRRPPRRTSTFGRDPLALVVDACTALLVIAHGAYANIVRGDEWDFWAIWGLKARLFLEHRGIDWRFLEHPFNTFAHPDYPLLVPLHYVHVVLFEGSWNDRWLGILTTFFAAALLLIVRDLFEEELQRPVVAALATLAVASASFSTIGLADGPMIAFAAAGLLTIRRGSVTTGSVLLGLAASTKNEGLMLILATAVALWGAGVSPARAGHPARGQLSDVRSAIVRLWPAAAIAAPWLILRAVHSLPTDLLSGTVFARVSHNLARLPELGRALVESVHHPLFWIAIVVTLVVFGRELAGERFVLIAVALQMLAYVGAYLVTPYPIRWHVLWSWPRLLSHISVPLAFVALVLCARVFMRASDRRTSSAAE